MEKKDSQSIVIIKRSSAKEYTDRTSRDHEEQIWRRACCGSFFDRTQEMLRQLFGDVKVGKLRLMAIMIAKQANIKIDRLAKRINDCLICWFCENWNKVSILLLSLSFSKAKEEIRSILQQNPIMRQAEVDAYLDSLEKHFEMNSQEILQTVVGYPSMMEINASTPLLNSPIWLKYPVIRATIASFNQQLLSQIELSYSAISSAVISPQNSSCQSPDGNQQMPSKRVEMASSYVSKKEIKNERINIIDIDNLMLDFEEFVWD
ncbi:hypothetical protein TRFO_20293 [Tritrichomonas foetus]|uniref:Uncharacterized protein n=1 Tax=Tritrichomonas foetus TaxID=1144522 RepID=A0A1J4KHI6_9EUKA|nr:hypothetical protein TRFO_20293 [Tritrichomonas foetus]|eukprot:OHT10416.1 hypothetical protein TRFO_20293 [Tritrichomonas foetus]